MVKVVDSLLLGKTPPMRQFLINLICLTVPFLLQGQHDVEPLADSISNRVFFSFGTNLDFVGEDQTPGLYYDLSTFIPKLPFSDESRWGLETRLAQGKYMNADSLGRGRAYFRPTGSANTDTVSVFRQDFRIIKEEDVSYLYLSLTPTLRLGSNSFFYLVGHFEFVRKATQFNQRFRVDDQQTLLFSEENSDQIPRTTSVDIQDRSTASKRVDFNFNYGVGCKIFLDLDGVMLNIKPILGIGGMGENTGAFYHTHFEVMEKKFGFKVGGELRGIISGSAPIKEIRSNTEPNIALYVSKTFNLAKIRSLLKL